MGFWNNILGPDKKVIQLSKKLEVHIGEEAMKSLRSAASEHGHHYYACGQAVSAALQDVVGDLLLNDAELSSVEVVDVQSVVNAAKEKIKAQKVMGKSDVAIHSIS